MLHRLASAASIVWLAFSMAGCPQRDGGGATARWQSALVNLPGGLLSVSGTSATDVYAVGSDPGDGRGPLVLHYHGDGWTRLNTGVSEGLGFWWITDRMVGDSFFLGGEGGLIMRYRPATGQFERHATPGTQTIFGLWGVSPNNVFAVGGDANDPFDSGVIWRYDGTSWTATDVTSIVPTGIPVLFKVWGRSENEVYACGARGALLRFDGSTWTSLSSPTTRTLFTIHGNASLVVAVGGAQSGVIVDDASGSFADVTPEGALQQNGTFVPASGDPVTVGLEGSIAFRRNGAWQMDDTGLNIDPQLDYHAAWIDPEGGIWAVGGQIKVEPNRDGLISYFGTRTVSSTLADP